MRHDYAIQADELSTKPSRRVEVVLRRLLLNSSLSMGSVLFCLIIAEIICRIFFPDMKIKYENDPELLVRFQPNQEGIIYLNNGAPAPKVRINELGLRGTNLQSTSSRRILFLGDSFTFGAGVEEEESFSALVGYALGDEVTVINGGQPGYGIYQMEVLLRRLSPVVQPELVVVVIWQNLLLRQPISEVEHQAFLEKGAKIQKLKDISVLGTHIYRMYERLLLSFHLNKSLLVLGTHEESNAFLDEQYRNALEADSVRLLAIDDTARSYGAQLMIVYWPREGFAATEITGISTELISQLKALSEGYHIPFYSVQDVLEVHPLENLSIPHDGHPTPLAHCLVARKLVGSLEELGYRAARSLLCASEQSSS